MTRRSLACALLLVIGTLTIGCQTTPSPTVKALSVAGPAPAVGASKQFTATATFVDGSTQDVTNVDQSSSIQGPYWWSGNTSVATVSSTGVVTGVAQGSATIYAKYHSFTGSAAIQVQ